MRKLLAISCTTLLHLVFITGFAAIGAAGVQIAAERAAHVWTV